MVGWDGIEPPTPGFSVRKNHLLLTHRSPGIPRNPCSSRGCAGQTKRERTRCPGTGRREHKGSSESSGPGCASDGHKGWCTSLSGNRRARRALRGPEAVTRRSACGPKVPRRLAPCVTVTGPKEGAIASGGHGPQGNPVQFPDSHSIPTSIPSEFPRIDVSGRVGCM